MQSKIVNCCKILLICFVVVSCGKSKEDEKLFEELNNSLENSNTIIKKKTEDCFRRLEADSQKPETREKATIWLAKARAVDSFSDELIVYLDSLQQQTKGLKNFEGKEREILYNYLISYKQKILAVDDRIKTEFGTVITLTHNKKDSVELTINEFNSNFSLSNSFIQIAMLKNRIEMIKEMVVEYFSQRYCVLNMIYDDSFRAIAYQNSTHFKPKETLQITAGIGAFTNDINGKVKIDGKEVKLNDEGIAEFTEAVPKKSGVYHKKILLQYTKPDGTIATAEKEIIYTVDE